MLLWVGCFGWLVCFGNLLMDQPSCVGDVHVRTIIADRRVLPFDCDHLALRESLLQHIQQVVNLGFVHFAITAKIRSTTMATTKSPKAMKLGSRLAGISGFAFGDGSDNPVLDVNDVLLGTGEFIEQFFDPFDRGGNPFYRL